MSCRAVGYDRHRLAQVPKLMKQRFMWTYITLYQKYSNTLE